MDSYTVYQTSKSSYELPVDLLHPIQMNEPFHTLTMDFIIGLLISKKGFDILLIIIEKFFKVIKLIACKTTTSTEEMVVLYIE
jgi:hypothetical protein